MTSRNTRLWTRERKREREQFVTAIRSFLSFSRIYIEIRSYAYTVLLSGSLSLVISVPPPYSRLSRFSPTGISHPLSVVSLFLFSSLSLDFHLHPGFALIYTPCFFSDCSVSFRMSVFDGLFPCHALSSWYLSIGFPYYLFIITI